MSDDNTDSLENYYDLMVAQMMHAIDWLGPDVAFDFIAGHINDDKWDEFVDRGMDDEVIDAMDRMVAQWKRKIEV